MSSTSFSPPADWYEPPEPGPECLWCDSTSVVEVASIVGADGKPQNLPRLLSPPMIECPRCDGTGVEPRPERED